MQFSQNFKPAKLNLDKTPKALLPEESFFLLNNEVNNPNALGKAVPMAANFLACDMELPAGENYNIGRHYAAITNELYSWHYNSNGINHIQRINGDGICEVVYHGDCLKLSADPQHSIEQFRAVLDVDILCNKVPGGKLKRLVWVDGTDTPIGSLDVEASIATDSFSTPFFDRCADDCALLQLCVPETDGCLNGELVPFTDADKGKTNYLLDKGLKFMYRYVYYDGRASEWSDRSTLYFQDAKTCFDTNDGLSRCMKFRLPIGNPMVDIIEFAFSEDGGITWFISERIEKYKKYNTTQQYWYQRDLSELVSSTYSDVDCSFDYVFCGDKGRESIEPLQVSRVLNPIPRGAQGIFRLKEAMAFYNYEKGFCPVDKSEADKFGITLNCSAVTSCETKLVKVTVRAVIFQPSVSRNVFIYRLTGGDGAKDDPTEAAWWSTTHSPLIGQPYVFQGYDQTFKDKTRNFIVYIEGTDYWGEMEQWRGTPGFDVNKRKKVGVLSGMSAGSVVGKHRDDIKNGNYYYQEYTFTVPKGTKGFIRVASHHQTSGIGSNQDTSTQVYSVGDNIKNYTGTTNLALDENKNEIYFDACDDADLDIMQFFIIEDFYTIDTAGSPTVQSSAYNGYITDKNKRPVEGARIYHGGQYEVTTDHNGFYSFYIYNGQSSSIFIDVYVEQSCSGGLSLLETFQSSSDLGSIADVDYEITSDAYKDGFYTLAKVPVTDCNNLPVSGVRIAISGSKYKVTNSDGIAIFKLRNYSTRDRKVIAIVMGKGNCFLVDCNGLCNPCMPSTPSTQLAPCFPNSTAISQYALTLNSKINVVDSGSKISLKKGGRYGFGIVAEGDCGVLSAVNEIGYFDIPRLQDVKGNCVFTYNANGITLPAGTSKLKIVRTGNFNSFDIQWIVDAIERTSDSKIKLTIQSLNDFNANHNFKTNTGYKFSQGDRVEFIRNGDGKLFKTDEKGILSYLAISPFNDEVLSSIKSTDDVNFFNQLLIEDDGKLDDLVAGALIEIQTPNSLSAEQPYYEFCTSIPVGADGKLLYQTGTFETFDTYLVSRQIGKFPAQFFESKSPSDFWGVTTVGNEVNFLSDIGKVHFVNKYENQKRYGRNISINSSNQLNYFGDIERTLDGVDQGDIIAIALKGDKLGLAICENEPFLFQVSDDLVRMGADNVIHAASASQVISNPEANLKGKFGCQYPDVGSIYFGDGYAKYIDSQSNTDVIHNYRFAKEAGLVANKSNEPETTCRSFFIKRIRQKENLNKAATNFLDHYRYSTGIDTHTGTIYQTLKTLRQAGVNNSKAIYELPNDTIMYNPDNDSYLGFAGFTPEGYNTISLNNDLGCSFISFQNSLPYITPMIADKWNEFYGIACDWIVGVTVNEGGGKIKVPFAFELQSDSMFYVNKVTTDKTNFLSEVPPIRVKKNQQGKWNAAFLNNINSRGGLYDGEAARGYYMNVLFVRDNTLNLAYGTVDNNKRTQYSELDEIMIKFSLSEQSGFDSNL